ncbi:helix-turn-helix transcriptional regulator [Rhizobium oryziradicis]|nr:LuxR family transcriptional regulator [Rhizobium oryziradicis]
MDERSASSLAMAQTKARDAVKTASDVISALKALCEIYQVEHATYHVMQNTVSAVDSPFVRTTYPAEWVGHYLTKNYVNIDPVVLKVMDSHRPFDWGDLEWTGAGLDMLRDARTFGVGEFGYSIPLTDDGKGRAVLSFNTCATPSAWAALVEAHAAAWRDIAVAIHHLAKAEQNSFVDDMRPLARRERECLALAAQGKSHKEISLILSISDYTARGHLTSARLKLKCRNTVHAVAKATKLRIIDPV